MFCPLLRKLQEQEGFSLWCTAGPAALCGLELKGTSQSKGIISPGEEITFSDRVGKVEMKSTRD